MCPLRAHGRLSWRQGTLLIFVLLGCIQSSQCIFKYHESEAVSLQGDDQFTRAVAAAVVTAEAAGAHGRSLLQNPDRPALNKYGGVNMTGAMMQGCALKHQCLTLACCQAIADAAADELQQGNALLPLAGLAQAAGCCVAVSTWY